MTPYTGADLRLFLYQPHVMALQRPLHRESQSMFIEADKGVFFRHVIDSRLYNDMQCNIYDLALVLTKAKKSNFTARGVRGSAGSGRGVRTLVEFLRADFAGRWYSEFSDGGDINHCDLMLEFLPREKVENVNTINEINNNSIYHRNTQMSQTYNTTSANNNNATNAYNNNITRFTDVTANRVYIHAKEIPLPTCVFPLKDSVELFYDSCIIVTSVEDLLFVINLMKRFIATDSNNNKTETNNNNTNNRRSNYNNNMESQDDNNDNTNENGTFDTEASKPEFLENPNQLNLSTYAVILLKSIKIVIVDNLLGLHLPLMEYFLDSVDLIYDETRANCDPVLRLSDASNPYVNESNTVMIPATMTKELNFYGAFVLWGNYFNSVKKCWEPLFEHLESYCLYEKSCTRGTGFILSFNSSIHINITSSLIKCMEDFISMLRHSDFFNSQPTETDLSAEADKNQKYLSARPRLNNSFAIQLDDRQPSPLNSQYNSQHSSSTYMNRSSHHHNNGGLSMKTTSTSKDDSEHEGLDNNYEDGGEDIDNEEDEDDNTMILINNGEKEMDYIETSRNSLGPPSILSTISKTPRKRLSRRGSYVTGRPKTILKTENSLIEHLHFPPLNDAIRVGFSVLNLTGQSLRYLHTFEDGKKRIQYLYNNERGALNFVASTTSIRNNIIVEERFDVQHDRLHAQDDSRDRSFKKRVVGHQVSLQISGFKWLEKVQADELGVKYVNLSYLYGRLNILNIIDDQVKLAPNAIEMKRLKDEKSKIRNALKLVTEVEPNKGGRMLLLRSVFKVTNKTNHDILLFTSTTRNFSQAMGASVPDSDKIPFKIAPGESFCIPLALLHMSIIKNAVNKNLGNTLGCLWFRPADLSPVNLDSDFSNSIIDHIKYSNEPIDLKTLIDETYTLFESDYFSFRPDGSLVNIATNPHTTNFDFSSAAIGMGMMSDNQNASNDILRKGKQLCCLIETRSKRDRSGGLNNNNTNNTKRYLEQTTIATQLNSKVPPFYYNVDVRRYSPSLAKISSKKAAMNDNDGISKLTKYYFHKINQFLMMGNSDTAEDDDVPPLHYSIDIHPPILLENLLPVDG